MHCIDIYLEHYHNDKTPTTDLGLHEAEIFIKCLQTSNRDLTLQYYNKMYLQKCSLAMGVADSPDLANLYGWFFERNNPTLNDPLIPFYGQYIDDICTIVSATSEESL